MLPEDLQASLSQVSFLHGFPPEDLAHLARNARTLAVSAGQVIFRQGDPATDSYFLLHGLAVLEICTPGLGCRRIATVSPGELLGWSPVLNHERLFATARAVSDFAAIVIPGNEIRELCESNPEFGFAFMKRTAQTLAARLSAARLQLLDVFAQESPVSSFPASAAGGPDAAER